MSNSIKPFTKPKNFTTKNLNPGPVFLNNLTNHFDIEKKIPLLNRWITVNSLHLMETDDDLSLWKPAGRPIARPANSGTNTLYRKRSFILRQRRRREASHVDTIYPLPHLLIQLVAIYASRILTGDLQAVSMRRGFELSPFRQSGF